MFIFDSIARESSTIFCYNADGNHNDCNAASVVHWESKASINVYGNDNFNINFNSIKTMTTILYSKKTKQRLFLSTKKGEEHLKKLVNLCMLRYEAFDFKPIV